VRLKKPDAYEFHYPVWGQAGAGNTGVKPPPLDWLENETAEGENRIP